MGAKAPILRSTASHLGSRLQKPSHLSSKSRVQLAPQPGSRTLKVGNTAPGSRNPRTCRPNQGPRHPRNPAPGTSKSETLAPVNKIEGPGRLDPGPRGPKSEKLADVSTKSKVPKAWILVPGP